MSGTAREAKMASDFPDANVQFLWSPYIPIGDYTVLMADGGTGKTVFCAGIAAAITSGKTLPGQTEKCPPRTILFISAEDDGSVLKKRLSLSGADLERCAILDREASEGMNLDERFEEFAATVKRYAPALLIIDPWHAYLGRNVDISRVNAVRPILHRLANLAAACNCGVIAVSHVNKRSQTENCNNAATGSTDFINAARSAIRLIFDEEDADARIAVHTKSNYAGYGRSVRYQIEDGGLIWSGFSDITKQPLEEAARKRSTPGELIKRQDDESGNNTVLIEAIRAEVNPFVPTRLTYDEFKSRHGQFIFGSCQPKRALDAIRGELCDEGIMCRTGIQVKHDGKKGNGFYICRVEAEEPKQVKI